MIKRIVIMLAVFVLAYTGIVYLQIFLAGRGGVSQETKTQGKSEATHRVYAFSFTKFAPGGEKEIEIEGDSANILTQNVLLRNVVAKAYAEETPVTITADRGDYDKKENLVHLKENVVATTDDGTRLLTEELDIYPSERIVESGIATEVNKDNINVDGFGARGDSNLKKVRFERNVTVVVQDPDEASNGPTVITCDGPLVIDYEKNIAHFKNSVMAEDHRGKLIADEMDVYYNKVSRQVSKIVATGDVMIENPDGNKTFSDSVIYLADEGRIILGGDAEALYYRGEKMAEDLFL